MKTRRFLIPCALSLGLILTLLWLLGRLPVVGPPIAQAQAGTGVIRVATTGADVPGCGSAGAPCRTVQYAVDQAAGGDEIHVAAGVYSGAHTRIIGAYHVTQTIFISKSITVRGGYAADFVTWDPQTYPTTLDAQSQGRVILIRGSGGLTVTLEGLRIVNGRNGCDLMDGGGGIGADALAALTIRNCDIIGNTAYWSDYGCYADGGGLRLSASTLVLENSRILSNTASMSGGGLWARQVAVTMTHNLLQGNDSGSSGGGTYLYECSAYIADNTFQSNTSTSGGGGLRMGWGDLVLTRNSILGNTADSYGGGLYAEVSAGHTYSITHNLIQGNIVTANSDTAKGGGALLFGAEGAQLLLDYNQVLNNAADGSQPSEGGGLFIAGPVHLSDNLIQSNWANSDPNSAGNGGGLYVTGPAWLERNRILDNRASETGDWGGYYTAYGAGVYVARGVVTMTNNIIARNRCCETCYLELYYTDGDAIYIGGQTSPTETQVHLTHNTIADNGVGAIRNESAALITSHNIFSGHTRDLRMNQTYGGYPPPTTVADCTLWYPAMDIDYRAGTLVHTNDFTGTPDFVSTPLDNYHLGPASQAIDRGPGAGVSTDIDGNPRPIGAGYDLGADEYVDVDLSHSSKSASPQDAALGEAVTFTIVLRNSGTASAANTTLFDAIPLSTTYVPGSAQATVGVVTDADGIHWTGSVAPGAAVTVTFQVTLNQAAFIGNTAIVTDKYGTSIPLTAWVNARRIYLPLVLR